MTHDRDLDRVLDRWMDDGPTVVADRVIATAITDVHTTRQRGARWASPKEIAARAGHTSVVTVLDRYGHLLPGSEDVNAALDALPEGAVPAPVAAVVPLLRDGRAMGSAS